MYCNKCGYKIGEDNNFCKKCGYRFIKKDVEFVYEENTKTTSEKHKNEKGSLGGWLTLVGLGLIVGLGMQVYGVLGYLPLLSETYDIPGYLTLLQFEFLVTVFYIFYVLYLLFLYFKKRIQFPKLYIYYLLSSVVYGVVDHMWLASLSAPTQEQQQAITDALSTNAGDIGKAIFVAVIWVSYMKMSKQVKNTFVNN